MKTESKHTPGPWFNPADSVSVFDGRGKERHKICDAAWVTINVKDARANARLIAAAPELLNALQLAQATIERLHRHAPGSAKGTLDVITAAIAKAEDRE